MECVTFRQTGGRPVCSSNPPPPTPPVFLLFLQKDSQFDSQQTLRHVLGLKPIQKTTHVFKELFQPHIGSQEWESFSTGFITGRADADGKADCKPRHCVAFPLHAASETDQLLDLGFMALSKCPSKSNHKMDNCTL